jgi:hypothetical protein
MSDLTRPRPEKERRGLYARIIDNFNPAITLLVLVWVVGLTARRILIERGQLEGIADRGLTSLAFVVPLMLLGWAADRFFDLGVFPREEED